MQTGNTPRHRCPWRESHCTIDEFRLDADWKTWELTNCSKSIKSLELKPSLNQEDIKNHNQHLATTDCSTKMGQLFDITPSNIFTWARQGGYIKHIITAIRKVKTYYSVIQSKYKKETTTVYFKKWYSHAVKCTVYREHPWIGGGRMTHLLFWGDHISEPNETTRHPPAAPGPQMLQYTGLHLCGMIHGVHWAHADHHVIGRNSSAGSMHAASGKSVSTTWTNKLLQI